MSLDLPLHPRVSGPCSCGLVSSIPERRWDNMGATSHPRSSKSKFKDIWGFRRCVLPCLAHVLQGKAPWDTDTGPSCSMRRPAHDNWPPLLASDCLWAVLDAPGNTKISPPTHHGARWNEAPEALTAELEVHPSHWAVGWYLAVPQAPFSLRRWRNGTVPGRWRASQWAPPTNARPQTGCRSGCRSP